MATTTLEALEPKALAMNADTCKTVAAATGNHASIMEPKLDGWRLLAVMGDDEVVRLYTREGIEHTGKLPAVEAELAKVLVPGSVLDGEAVAFTTTDAGNIIHDCGSVTSVLNCSTAKAALRSGAITYVVFDILSHGGIDARTLPFSQRRMLLEGDDLRAGMLDNLGPCVRLIPQMDATDENYDKLLDLGYEGAVVKWLDAPYRSKKRGQGWGKLKAQTTVEVVLMGYKPGEDGWLGYVGALYFGQHDADGNLVQRGVCSGMDWDLRVKITENPDDYLGTVFEMAHMGVWPPTTEHPYGAFRHPQFKRLRPDRVAESVLIHDA